jgi:hypothetical protein
VNSCYLGMFHGSVAMAGPGHRPSVDSSFGLRCVTDAGQRTGPRDVESRAPRRALSVTKFRNPFPTFCLVVCWRGQCEPFVFGGRTERIGFRREGSSLPIVYNPGGVD